MFAHKSNQITIDVFDRTHCVIEIGETTIMFRAQQSQQSWPERRRIINASSRFAFYDDRIFSNPISQRFVLSMRDKRRTENKRQAQC